MIVEPGDSDCMCAVSWRTRPGSFASLMTLYESNYIRLGWLVPDVETVHGTLISRVSNDCPLYLTLEERSRYTSTFTLTYRFESPAVGEHSNDSSGEPAIATLADPDLQIRVYHDARLAEVRSCARWHRHAALQSIRSELARDLGDRWLRNIMLNKWLDYCVERGHRFPTTVASSVEIASSL
jgi:uncharacterized protein YqiB (DUF1249 family)